MFQGHTAKDTNLQSAFASEINKNFQSKKKHRGSTTTTVRDSYLDSFLDLLILKRIALQFSIPQLFSNNGHKT